MFLSAVFGHRWRNMSRSPMCHKMEISFKQNYEKIGKNENRYHNLIFCPFDLDIYRYPKISIRIVFIDDIPTASLNYVCTYIHASYIVRM